MSFKEPTTYTRMSFSLALGLLGAFGMGHFYIWPLLLISLSLFWVTFTGFANDKPWKSFLSGFMYGFGFYCGSLWWIGNALLVGGNPFKWAYPLAVCGLPALLSLFPMLAVGFTRLFSKGRSLKSYSVFLCLFFTTEWARGHLFTGFPWNLTGMTWTTNLPVMQILSVGGMYTLTALSIFMLSVTGFAWKGDSPRLIRYSLVALALLIFVSLNLFGMNRLNKNPTTYHKDVVVQLIQPNIAQEDKCDGSKVWDNYRSLLNILKPDEMATYTSPIKTRLIVLPETALTYHELGTPQARDALLGKLSGYSEPNVYLLSGALLHDAVGYHNALVALDQQGNLLKTFDKFHLVPFGE
ncbi:MAG: apolipoprotein N-acyltransferase, partial [Pseudomonadota bacterium]